MWDEIIYPFKNFNGASGTKASFAAMLIVSGCIHEILVINKIVIQHKYILCIKIVTNGYVVL